MIKEIKPKIFQFYFKEFSSCIYLIKLKDKNILIDTGSKEAKNELLSDFNQLNLSPKDINIVLLTHSHWDHAGNIGLFKNAEIYSYENISELSIKEIKIIKVPGHTKDSLAFLYYDILFSGDTLFNNGIGRTDFPESVPEKMQDSLDKLRSLNYKILAPGHI